MDQFDGIFEMYPTSIKKLYVVDGGLSFNSPFPLLLRPQRFVDLILSFDFSARPTDTSPPFKVRSVKKAPCHAFIIYSCIYTYLYSCSNENPCSNQEMRVLFEHGLKLENS